MADILLAAKRRLQSPPDFVGHYNSNYVFEYDLEKVVARKSQPARDDFDVRMMSESDALSLAEMASDRVPRLLYSSIDILIESFCVGRPIDLSQQNWSDLYRGVIDEMLQVYALDASSIAGPSTVDEWWSWMHLFIDSLWRELQPQFHDRYEAVGVEPLTKIWQQRESLYGMEQPTRLVHSDLHDGNILIEIDRPGIPDWELSLKADPLWDAAVALQRTRWKSTEQQLLAQSLWLASIGDPDSEDILEIYLVVERWKSVLVDTVRYPREIQLTSFDATMVRSRAASLSRKLSALALYMPCAQPTQEETSNLLVDWARFDEK